MKKRRSPKSLARRIVKQSLVGTKKVLAKSPHVRKAARLVKNVLFTDPRQNFYNVNRYQPTIADYKKQTDGWQQFAKKPLISIVMPTYNTPIEYLRRCIESVLLQSYPNWELCISDDCSPNAEVFDVLKEYSDTDKRIKVMRREKNGHISAATNSAIELAGGEFIALLDHDDIIWPNALYEIVVAINEHPEVDFLYSDEDKINQDDLDHSYPFFKPDFSPEFLESCNYITHFSCIRASVIKEVGGFRVGYEGAQDWDLFLRISEQTSRIIHIPKVLYSWRIHEASTAMDTDAKPYVYEAQHKLLVDHIERSGESARVKQGVIKQHASIEYAVAGEPLVSIVVFGDDTSSLKLCLASLSRHTSYANVEIILAAKDARQAQVYAKYMRTQSNCRVVNVSSRSAEAFNQGAKDARGEFIVFLDGSMVIRTPRWVELLLGDAQREGVGVVGGKTLKSSKDRIMRAACATGIYGLYAPLLEGMPADDVHYLRGLYGQSRRNVIAIDSGCIMMAASAWQRTDGFKPGMGNMYVVDLCLSLFNSGLRHIYNPFVETVDQYDITAGDLDQNRTAAEAKAFSKKWQKYIDNDPYLNPNFSRTNAQLEIK